MAQPYEMTVSTEIKGRKEQLLVLPLDEPNARFVQPRRQIDFLRVLSRLRLLIHDLQFAGSFRHTLSQIVTGAQVPLGIEVIPASGDCLRGMILFSGEVGSYGFIEEVPILDVDLPELVYQVVRVYKAQEVPIRGDFAETIWIIAGALITYRLICLPRHLPPR